MGCGLTSEKQSVMQQRTNNLGIELTSLNQNMLIGLKSSLSPMQMSNPKCKHTIYNRKMQCNLLDTLFLWNHFLKKIKFLWFFLCLRWCKIWVKKREHNVKYVLNSPPNLNYTVNKNQDQNKQQTKKNKKLRYIQ